MIESKKRSVYKTISWHLIHIFLVAIIAFVVTGSIKFAAIIASFEMLFETFLFFAHERAWARFGKGIK
jgi:uncharacterized membrane protein